MTRMKRPLAGRAGPAHRGFAVSGGLLAGHSGDFVFDPEFLSLQLLDVKLVGEWAAVFEFDFVFQFGVFVMQGCDMFFRSH